MTFPRAPGDPSSIFVPDAVPRLLRDLVHERTGLYFEADRLDTMVDKLQPRVVAHGFASFLDYYYLLKYEEQGPDEWRRVMDAFSVPETYFWREYDQIRVLVEVIVPDWFRRTQQPLRIWSAACATGEEPYTIAMALEEAGWGGHPIEIHASDASEHALAKARAATYRERSFRSLPVDLRSKYFHSNGDGALLDRRIADRVTFRWANLVSPADYADLQNLQVIFCRNVFIYFSAVAIRRVVSAFSERIDTHGQLFVGASESLLKLTDAFELHDLRGAFVYRRRPPS